MVEQMITIMAVRPLNDNEKATFGRVLNFDFDDCQLLWMAFGGLV